MYFKPIWFRFYAPIIRGDISMNTEIRIGKIGILFFGKLPQKMAINTRTDTPPLPLKSLKFLLIWVKCQTQLKVWILTISLHTHCFCWLICIHEMTLYMTLDGKYSSFQFSFFVDFCEDDVRILLLSDVGYPKLEFWVVSRNS